MFEWEFRIIESNGPYGSLIVTAADEESAWLKANRLLMRADGVTPRGGLEEGFTLYLRSQQPEPDFSQPTEDTTEV